MTSDEAKQALKEGKRVRAVKWWSHEYIEKGEIINNFGEAVDEVVFEDYKDDEWEEWEEGE
jgi:hypothetical protein